MRSVLGSRAVFVLFIDPVRCRRNRPRDIGTETALRSQRHPGEANTGMQRSLLVIPPSPRNGSNGSIPASPATTRVTWLGWSATDAIFFRVECSRDTGLAMSSNMISEGRSSAAVAPRTRSAAGWDTSISA